MNYTYILRCADDSLYTGWTNNLEHRLLTHNKGQGAKYTRSRLPVRLAYFEEFATKEEAQSRECQIKRLPRLKKQQLVEKGIAGNNDEIARLNDIVQADF